MSSCTLFESKRYSGAEIAANTVPQTIETDTAAPPANLVPPAIAPVTNPAADSARKAEMEQNKKKKKKNVFMGYKTKKGYTKTGRGKGQTIETFRYLKEYKEPNPYAPERYYYHTKKRRIYKTTGEIDPSIARIPHGPYKKTIAKQVVEQGYFYMGTKHLRWEKYNRKDVLLDKVHYEKGFPRDAVVLYYDAGNKQVKEIIPYENGEIHGDYRSYYENGQPHWAGQFEHGKKVGVWIQFYDFRGRRHYEFQYPESAGDEPFEPYLIKQYDRHGKLIFEKDKLDLRTTTATGQWNASSTW